jgi:hypothetical protein
VVEPRRDRAVPIVVRGRGKSLSSVANIPVAEIRRPAWADLGAGEGRSPLLVAGGCGPRGDAGGRGRPEEGEYCVVAPSVGLPRRGREEGEVGGLLPEGIVNVAGRVGQSGELPTASSSLLPSLPLPLSITLRGLLSAPSLLSLRAVSLRAVSLRPASLRASDACCPLNCVCCSMKRSVKSSSTSGTKTDREPMRSKRSFAPNPSRLRPRRAAILNALTYSREAHRNINAD